QAGRVGALALLAPASPSAAAEERAPDAAPRLLLPTPTPTQNAGAEGAAPLVAVARNVQGATTPTPPPPAAPATPPPVPTPAATPTVPTAYPQPARMNVRSGPGTDFAVLPSVDAGTALEITGQTADSQWYRVNVDGLDEPGWLFAGLTTTAGPLGAVAVLAQEDLPQLSTPEAAEAN